LPTPRRQAPPARRRRPRGHIAVTGNTVIDALLDVSNRPYSFAGTPLEAAVRFETDRPGHRPPRESFGDPSNPCAADSASWLSNTRTGSFSLPVHRIQRASGGQRHLSGIDNVR
jgi:hypothetical protein